MGISAAPVIRFCLCAVSLFALGGQAHAQTPAGTLELAAARARVEKTEGRTEVRLLWIVSEGWLPASGVNVFRSDNPTKPLNATPITFNTALLDAAGASVINTPTAPTKKLFAGAIAGRETAALSSKAAFSAYKAEAVRLQTVPGTRGSQIGAQAAKVPEVATYRSRLLPPKPITVTRKTPVALTPDEAAASVRIQVMIAALTSYQAAEKSGFAFRDKTAQATATYTYTIKSADTAQTLLATTSISGEDKTTPPPPADADGVQNGAGSVNRTPVNSWADLMQNDELNGKGSVALHWEPISADDEKKLVSVSYNVFRGTKKLNTSPLRIVFQPTKEGSHVAPMVSFVDANAPIGTVTYNIKLTDAFGRESAASQVSVVVKDFRAPGPVKGIVAHPSLVTPGAVRLIWFAPAYYTGDINPMLVTGASTVHWPDTTYALFRAEGRQTETPLGMVGTPTSNPTNLAAGAAFPPDLRDITLKDLLTVSPEAETYMRAFGGSWAGMSDKDFAALYPLTLDKLCTDGGKKYAMGYMTMLMCTYLDTAATPDSDYVYRIAPAYVINPAQLGTGAQTSTVSVPTPAAPGMPANLQAVFQKGTGNFGFADTATASGLPTLRTQGKVGVAVQPSRIAPAIAQKHAKPAYLPPHLLKPGFVSLYKGTPVDTEKVPMTIAGQIKLTWQAVPFTSKIRYRIYRATATGLFPSVQSASLGLPPAVSLNTVPKIGGSQKLSMKAVAAKRLSVKMAYYQDFPNVPNQNYALLTVTDNPQYVDTVSTSQRVHYHYRIIPVTRWGVEGPETPLTDVMVPATLPPTLPTLLKTEVDEATTGGQVKLTLTLNPPQDNVQKYLIFRKPIPATVPAAAPAGHTGLVNRSSVQVASSRPRFAVVAAAPPVPQTKLNNPTPARAQRVTIGDMKANNSALLKWILDGGGYVKVGEVTAPTASAATQNPLLTWTDTSGLPKVQYAYEVVAINTDAIASKPSSPLDATALKVKAAAPSNLAAVLDTTGDPVQIKLSWRAPAQEPAAHYVLERTVEHLAPAAHSAPKGPNGLSSPAIVAPNFAGSPPPTYVTIDGNVEASQTSFSDKSVRAGRRYVYRLRAVDGEGLFSDALQKAADYPALAPAAFNDPAPAPVVKPAPTAVAVNPIVQPNNPVPAVAPAIPNPAPVVAGAPIASPTAASKAARFGGTYFLTAGQVFAVRVEKAQYRASAYAIDAQNFYYNRPTEKFLQLTLRVKNMTSSPQPFDYQTVTATSTTADGAELAVTKNWKALDTNTLANRQVAPNGELLVEGVVTVPADGTPRSLSFGDDVFDLTGGQNPVSPLPAAFGGGDTVAPEYPVPDAKAFWPMAFTEASFTQSGFTTENNASVYAVTLTVRNVTRQTIKIAPNNYTLELTDEDGDKYPSQKNDAAPVSVAPGATTILRWTFAAPKTIVLKTLKARERDSRTYLFPIGAK